MTATGSNSQIAIAIPDEAPGPEVVAAIKVLFERFDEVAPGLATRLVEFVVEGVDCAILSELEHSRSKAAAIFLDLKRYDVESVKYSAFIGVVRFAWKRNHNIAYRLSRVFSYIPNDIHAPPLSPVEGQPAIPQWLHVFANYFMMWPELDLLNIFVQELEHFLLKAGQPPTTLVHYLYRHRLYPADKTARERMAGVADFLRAHEALIVSLAPSFTQQQLLFLFQDIQRYRLTDGAFLDLALCAIPGPDEEVSRVARFIVRDAPSARAIELIGTWLDKGNFLRRRIGVELLGERGTDEAMLVLRRHMKKERDSNVIAAFKRAEQMCAARRTMMTREPPVSEGGAMAVPMIDGEIVVVPQIGRFEHYSPLLPEQATRFLSACQNYNEALLRQKAANPRDSTHFDEISAEEVEGLLEYLRSGQISRWPDGRPRTFAFSHRFFGRHYSCSSWAGYDNSQINEFLAGEFSLVQAARLAACVQSGYQEIRAGLLSQLSIDSAEDRFLEPLARKLREEGGDLRAAFEVLAPFDMTPRNQLSQLLREGSRDSPLPEPLPPSMFHLMIDHLDLFEEALGARPQSGRDALDCPTALNVLALFPKIPAALAPALLEVGLNGRKNQRKRAQALLAPAVGIDQALIVQLSSPAKEVRAEAAAWIGERRITSAEKALRQTLKAEKSEDSRAVMLTALARIGADISEEFSEKKLRAEAEKGLAAPIKSLGWFPFDAVPRVSWQSGKGVPPDVVKWWIVLADKLKNPAGNALFDLYLDSLLPADAAKLGLFLLEAFIARDTATCSEEEANSYATNHAETRQRHWMTWQQRNPNASPFDYAREFAEAKARKLSIHISSCSENRGILAFSIRAPGPEAAALVRRYLKDHGNKVNQSKALLTALARNPAPAAIQAVLAAANRLKQKTTQALARELVEAIAEDRGWTADELADRTMPTGGFDERGQLDLDCGAGRTFTAMYRGNGRIELQNTDGKPVKALPAARGDQDKDIIAEAKKALANARKEVKQVEAMQQARLYEAMCVERTWPVEAWATYLKPHPIAGRLCQRLVWLALDANGSIMTGFRLLDDGSLTDNADQPVTLKGATAVKLAHTALLDSTASKAWAEHLRDYEIAPLFVQFREGQTDISPAADATEIKDREGWMLDNLKLAATVGRLGYERGEVSDGGGFTEYVKRFEGVQIRAVLKFTGSYVGAGSEKFPCALETLSFERLRPGKSRAGLPLRMKDVPKVLLAECIGDLLACAAAGPGFDADWRNKSGY